MTKDEKQSLLARTAELYDSLLLLRGDFAGKFASSSIETEFREELAFATLHLNNVRYLISTEVPSDD